MKYNNISLLARQFGIVLGSRSPRRVTLLTEIGVKFRQVIPDLEENQLNGERPYDFAERLAQDKALAVAGQLTPDELVLGCDTIVVLKGEVLGKPENEQQALEILSRLSGQEHVVCTALAVADRHNLLVSGYELTKVYFNKVTKDQIGDYIRSGEPMDKAGAYGIQGMGAFLVDRIEGNLDNVVGFPRELLEKLAQRILQTIRTH